ncbi:hypothetical protein ACOMHN_057893 [Nucella lapillus]
MPGLPLLSLNPSADPINLPRPFPKVPVGVLGNADMSLPPETSCLPAIAIEQRCIIKCSWRYRDSNPRPQDQKFVALTTRPPRPPSPKPPPKALARLKQQKMEDKASMMPTPEQQKDKGAKKKLVKEETMDSAAQYRWRDECCMLSCVVVVDGTGLCLDWRGLELKRKSMSIEVVPAVAGPATTPGPAPAPAADAAGA